MDEGDPSSTSIFNASISGSESGFSSFISLQTEATEADKFLARAEQAIQCDNGAELTPEQRLLLAVNSPTKPFVGRQVEIATIQAAVNSILSINNKSTADNKVCEDDTANTQNNKSTKEIPRVISISGDAGTGKTCLSQKSRPELMEGGFFIGGKYSFNSTDTGLGTAMENLVDQILSRDFDMSIRRRLAEIIGPSDAAFLVGSFPVLSAVLEAGRDCSHDSPNETEQGVQRAKRLQFLFKQFIRTVLSSHHYEDEEDDDEGQNIQQEEHETQSLGMVLLLDDMQWVNQVDLELVSSIIHDPDIGSFLLLATSRPILVGQAIDHPFIKELSNWREQGICTLEIQLENLDTASINLLVANLLDVDEDSTKKLAAIIHRKTSGNPFFSIEFLKELVRQDLLSFNYGCMQWKWDNQRVQALATTTTSSPVDLLANKLKRMSNPHHKLLLLTAAWLGGFFDATLIETVYFQIQKKCNDILTSSKHDQQQDTDIQSALKFCVDSGFLNHDEGSYCFVHDLVKEAALEICMEEKRKLLLKMEVGRCIMDKIDETNISLQAASHLFLGVDLCNTSSSLLEDKKASDKVEWIRLAQFNFWAGRKAMKELTFALALSYMETGLNCLDLHVAEEQGSKLWFQLVAGAAEASCCLHKYDAMDAFAERLLIHNCPTDMHVQIMLYKIPADVARLSLTEAVEIGVKAIDLLGIGRLQMKPGVGTVLVQLFKTRYLLRSHTKESLLALPILAEQKRITAMRIIEEIIFPAHSVSPNLLLILILKTVRWACKYGISRYSSTSFGLYATVLLAVFGDVGGSVMFGEVALCHAERLDVKQSIAKASQCVFTMSRHLYSDMRYCYAPVVYAHKLAMESGDTETGVLCLLNMDIIAWCTSRFPLPMFSRHLERHCRLCREQNQEQILYALICLSQSLRPLAQGRKDVFAWLDTPGFSKKELQDDDPIFPTIRAFSDTLTMQKQYMLGEINQTLEFVHRTQGVGTKVSPGSCFVTRCQFFRGLVLISAACEGKDRRRNLRAASQVQRLMKKWTAQGNPNLEHMLQLIDSEYARATKNYQKASGFYAEAIKSANRKGHTQDLGICHECAARFYLQIQDSRRAAHHVEQAVNSFRAWGAFVKVTHLVEMYADLLKQHGSTSFSMKSSLSAIEQRLVLRPKTSPEGSSGEGIR